MVRYKITKLKVAFVVMSPTMTQKSNAVSAPTQIRHLSLSLDLHIGRKTLGIANKAFSYRPEHLHLEGLLRRTRSANLAVTVATKDSNVPDFVTLFGVDAINRHSGWKIPLHPLHTIRGRNV